MMQISRRTSGTILLAASLCCLCLVALTSAAQAQIIIRGGRTTFGGREIQPETSIAALPTDPDLESILEKAERFKADGNFRVATKLMQAVLERSKDAMYSDDEKTYFSLVRQVEQQLSDLPPEGLAAYRLETDAEALALITAGEQGDLASALSQVVNKFFISSVGDEAAFRLGRLYLDQYDFMSARRVFEKTLTHPDLSIPKDEILAHIAVCDLFLNDLKSAEKKSEQLKENASDLRIARLVSNEIDDIKSGGVNLSSARRSRTAPWEMILASSNRYGVGLPVDERMLGKDLVSTFQFYYDSTKPVSDTPTIGSFLIGDKAYGSEVDDTRTSFEKRMISSSKKQGWRPTGMLLFGPDEVYIKTAQQMIALKKSQLTIRQNELDAVLKNDDPKVAWTSLWKNLFEIDEGTFIRNGLALRWGSVVRSRGRRATKLDSPVPSSAPEIQAYGDTIASQFSIHNGILYSIEGKPKDDKSNRVKRKFSYGQSLTRARNNFLVAYDTKQEGKVLWMLPPDPNPAKAVVDVAVEDGEQVPSKFLEQGGLMGAPVGFHDSIIAPVNQNGSIWIYAFDPNDQGATLWKTHLCDEPTKGANPWSAVNVSIDGSDVLVSCGLGVVFVLDAAGGQIRIARRYERGGKPDPILGSSRWPGEKRLDYSYGWSSDTVIPYGRQMICFSSDATAIESIDRETGETIWKHEFALVSRKLDYLLGVYDGVLYAAGPETVVAFDLETRQHLWGGDSLFDEEVSLGKGILTPQGVFVPVGKKILQFELMPKKLTTLPDPVHSISVDLGGADVGNLFSDGERFWVHGGNRIYALEAKPE